MFQQAAWPAGAGIVCSVSLSFSLCSAKIRKRHEITLGKVKKVAAEGKNMKLVSDFLLLQRLESDVFADFGEHLRGDA